MFWLYRNRFFNEWIKDDYSGKIIAPGEYYFKDDETGKCMSCAYYWELKKADMKANNPYQDKLDWAQNQFEYKQNLEQLEREQLQGSVLQDAKFSYKEYR